MGMIAALCTSLNSGVSTPGMAHNLVRKQTCRLVSIQGQSQVGNTAKQAQERSWMICCSQSLTVALCCTLYWLPFIFAATQAVAQGMAHFFTNMSLDLQGEQHCKLHAAATVWVCAGRMISRPCTIGLYQQYLCHVLLIYGRQSGLQARALLHHSALHGAGSL